MILKELCNSLKLDLTSKFYVHKSKSTQKNKMDRIIRDFETQMFLLNLGGKIRPTID